MTVTLTADQVTWLNQGLLYYNVHSVINPNGEIRGQILPIVNYLGELTGAQDNQTTSSEGVGIAALYGSALWSAIYHNVANPTAAHIHTGAVGVAGPVTFPYADATTEPISQNFTASAQQISDFVGGLDYFNVHTAAAPGGLIRGQIYPKVAATTTTSAAPFVFCSFTLVFSAIVALLF